MSKNGLAQDAAQFAIGMKEEQEHHKGPAETKQLVLDHLREDPKYYTKLERAGIGEKSAGIGDLWHRGLQGLGLEDEAPWYRKIPLPAAIAGGGLLAAGGLTAARPALRAEARAFFKGLGRGGGRAVENSLGMPPVVREHAELIAKELAARGIDPRTARIGISATGGTGKSTLARALSDRLGMTHKILDDHGHSLAGRDLAKYVRDNPLPPGTIAEQTHLLNQVDPEQFDLMVKLRKPMEAIKSQILRRGRGATQLEAYDYDKLQKAIDTAFDTTRGAVLQPAEHIQMKFRPPEGYQASTLLGDKVRQQGLDPTEMDRQRQVLSATTGKLELRGVWPYIRAKNLGAGAGIVAGGAALGGFGASALSDEKTSSVRVADHPSDRAMQRSKLDPAYLKDLNAFLASKKLPPIPLHFPSPDGSVIALSPVGKRHIVSTVLAPGMKPKGVPLASVLHDVKPPVPYLRKAAAVDFCNLWRVARLPR